MAYQTYSEKLRNPKWQQKRLKIFERDNWTCKCCGDKERNQHVHHVDYIPGIDPWDYSDDMLITLCDVCHAKENGRIELEKNLATTLKMKGFLISDLLALSCKIDTNERFTISLLKTLRSND